MANDKIVSLTDDTFKSEVLESTTPVLVDFWAAWCGPCKMIAPVLDELADDYAGKVKIAKLNVDDHSRTAGELGVMSIPTLMIYKNGQMVERVVGFTPKEQLAKVLDKVL